MTPNETKLLNELERCYEHGSFAQACHGPDLQTAHALEQNGWAEWKGTQYGSNFYAITNHGLQVVKDMTNDQT